MTSSTTPKTQEPTTNSDADVISPELVATATQAQENADSAAMTPDTAAAVQTDENQGIEVNAGNAANEADSPSSDGTVTEAPDSASAQEKRPADKRSEKEKLQSAIHGTSYKDQPTLLALQKRLERLALDNSTDSPEELAALTAILEQRLSEHANWQKKLVHEIETSITQVTTRISDGKVTEAQSQLDRSQSQLRKIDAEEQARLQALITPLKEELSKLLDWKKFASSEKKKELIGKMQALVDDSTAPAQKAKLIRALQDEWKTLGHSDDNDALWVQFSELARVAFEPCKAYFKERKDKQAGNLIARNNICEQLEAYAATLADTAHNTPVNLNELTRLENQARDDWKKYAPVAQNKINALQSRFNAVLTTLKQHRRHAMQSHNAAKLALIEQAKALVSHDDLSAAIQQAKSLQQQWKELGPGSFKDDRKLWTDFRAACDALFARREEAGKERRQHGQQASSSASSAARDVLKKASALLSLDDEAFSESKATFAALSNEFRDALTPDLKNERKALQDQFSKISRQYDARLRATPDKKTLQLLQQVQAQASFCRELEEKLLSGAAQTESAEQLEQSWQDFEKVSEENLDQILKKRFRQLVQNINDGKSLTALTEKLELRGRELCVEAEIMLGAETPAADKAIRMQQQLNQLQRGLGRMPPSQKEKIQRLQSMELELTAMGPLQAVSRSSLENRLQQLKQKL
ncbi:MAG: DUF349 domain-containing protein [Pseudohongiella sp.]|nr:DUF349 domain-containing protein [Pseudohongiella sp.]